MSGGHEERDERRRKLNEKSKTWATRTGTWTDAEDQVIKAQWLPFTVRDEVAISKTLHRTIFSCQRRAQELRVILGISGDSHRGPVRHAPRPVCPRCFMELPVIGSCPDCD